MSMEKETNKHFKYSTIKKTCYAANIIYLVLHVFYLILFIVGKFNTLIYIDAAVILLYVLFFFLIKKKKYYIYALCCGNLFFGFISATTIMLGFNTGFHFYLIGLCVVSFFTTYFSRNRNTKGSIFWVGLSLAIYLTLYFVTQFSAPHYVVEKWMEMTLFTIHAAIVFAFIAAYLIVFLKYAVSLESKIMNESRTDELTQISNRYGLYDYFDEAEDKTAMVLALFDIDDFKNINDTYGHVTGDYVLQQVAAITTETLEDSFVCRYGGEEFVIILNSDQKNSYYTQLEKVRERIEKETFKFNGVKINITITLGAAEYSKDISLEKWVAIADERMYAGKKSGKNKVVL